MPEIVECGTNGSCFGVGVAEATSERRAQFESDALPLMNMLYGGALKLTRNSRDAEDLVQDTYVRAFERFHLFKPGTNLKAWMFRVMTNRFINLYRRRKARPENASYEDVDGFIGYEDQQLLSDFQSGEAMASLMKNQGFLDSLDDSLKAALQNLPDEYREVLIMNVIGEMAYKEIAAALDIPVGTVMSRLSRAKSMLRERLSELGSEEIPGVAEDALRAEQTR
ncbi:MAG: sigma-70 family RNA polymerase sigma factor [Planctomycetes bacterium]|nr:sigma-70 family RNA polymerase sigma factor [Planctomycetota bacterium]